MVGRRIELTDERPWLADDVQERAGWFAAVEGWIREQVAVAGLGAVSAVTPDRLRPWGAVLTVDTAAGRLWCKAVEPRRRFEVPVTATLSAGWPTLGPVVVAADEAEGWLLLRDHGRPIGEVLDPAQQIEAVAELLPAYAAMQRASTGELEGWLAAGLPDRRLPTLADRLRRILATLTDPALRAAVEAALPDLAAACDRLHALVPATALDHADLHGTNVVWDGTTARVIDWGDACATHPYVSLFVPLHFLVRNLATPAARRQATERLLDAFGTSVDDEAMTLATWIGPVVRVLSLADESDGEAEITELLVRWAHRRPDGR